MGKLRCLFGLFQPVSHLRLPGGFSLGGVALFGFIFSFSENPVKFGNVDSMELRDEILLVHLTDSNFSNIIEVLFVVQLVEYLLNVI